MKSPAPGQVNIDASLLEPLRILTAALQDAAVDWAITGSLGFALQGVPTAVHDIDIQTDRDGVYEIERRLAQYSQQAAALRTSELLRSYFGALKIEGIQVEIMGAMQKRAKDGGWGQPVQIAPIRRWVDYNGMHLPVLSLAHEYQAYLYLGRIEKARLLEKYISDWEKSR